MANFNPETLELRESINKTGEIPFSPIPADPRFQDLTGRVSGHLIVLGFAGRKRWFCRCECGTLTVVFSKRLTREPYTKSCGHLMLESHNIIHGEYRNKRRTTEYEIYCGAKARCQNPNDRAYHHYGGRGIEFRFESVSDLLEEVGRRPGKEYSLDRIDNDGHYEKGNVRWATWSQQARNRRPRKLKEKNDETQCN